MDPSLNPALARAFAPSEIPWPELAFGSTELALPDAVAPYRHGGRES